jgi:hypothetical protein
MQGPDGGLSMMRLERGLLVNIYSVCFIALLILLLECLPCKDEAMAAKSLPPEGDESRERLLREFTASVVCSELSYTSAALMAYPRSASQICRRISAGATNAWLSATSKQSRTNRFEQSSVSHLPRLLSSNLKLTRTALLSITPRVRE